MTRRTPWWTMAADTPWKAVNEARRLALVPLARAWFAVHGVAWSPGARIYGLPLLQRHRRSRIALGPGLELRSWFASNPLGVRQRVVLATWTANASLEIGEGTGISGSTICAAELVRIGRRVMVGAGCVIVDTDFHPLGPARRRAEPAAGASAPVVIGDDCFIGTHSLILKGASVGDGTVIGAGSVVTGPIPPGVVAAGNPARVLRALDEPGEDAAPNRLEAR